MKLLLVIPLGLTGTCFLTLRSREKTSTGIDPEMPLLRHRYKRIMKYDLPIAFVMR